MQRVGEKEEARNFQIQKLSAFWKQCKKQKMMIGMIIPGIILVFIFNYIPMYGAIIAFQKYNPAKGIAGSSWVGLKYFKSFFQDPYMLRLLRNTLLLGIYGLLWGFPAPIILALLLDQISNVKYKKFVQTVSYFPHFISAVVVVGLIKEIFAVDGVINDIRGTFGAQTDIPFLTDGKYFRTIFISSGVWQGIGWGSIIYLAALSNVDPQLHEAATIDGANRFQRVLYVNWPAIVPTMTVMLIFSVSGILGTDTQKVLLLYNPANYSTADVIGTYVYRLGLEGGRFEYSTAVGLVTNLTSCILLIGANTISRIVSENSLW